MGLIYAAETPKRRGLKYLKIPAAGAIASRHAIGRGLASGCCPSRCVVDRTFAWITHNRFAAYAEMMGNLPKHQYLLRAALNQMIQSNKDGEEAELGLDLAIRSGNVEAVLAFLELTPAPKERWSRFADDLRKLTSRLRTNGNQQRRRRAIRIERQIAAGF